MAVNLLFESVRDQEKCIPDFLSPQNLAYVKGLKEACQSVADYKSAIQNDPTFPFTQKQKGYFIPIQSVLQLLSQGNGTTEIITGLKIYFGESQDVDDTGKPLIDLIIVATAFDPLNSNATDFRVPVDVPAANNATDPLIGTTRPCPSQCGATNALNRQ